VASAIAAKKASGGPHAPATKAAYAALKKKKTTGASGASGAKAGEKQKKTRKAVRKYGFANAGIRKMLDEEFVDKSITRGGRLVLNHIAVDIARRVVDKCSLIIEKASRGKTLTPVQVISAVKLVVGNNELCKHTLAHVGRALAVFDETRRKEDKMKRVAEKTSGKKSASAPKADESE
jgi:hypothetical protein